MILFSAATVAALYRIGRGAEISPYSHDAHVLLYLSCIVHYRHDSNSILKSLSRDAYSVGKTLFVDDPYELSAPTYFTTNHGWRSA